MAGEKFGLYELKEEVGRGGMAIVYRAYQPTVDRYVALKVIQSNISDDPKLLERFQQEARVIARLEHPHILPVYDFDGAHEPPYIVMRFVDSGTLKELLQKRKLEYKEVSHLLRQIASALDYAHRQGILHRDIKPSNILLDREGNAVVADFGIARILDRSDAGITQQGEAVGTPGYISPEQGLGKPDLNRRTDIYSLAVVVYEMLTGQLPFQAENNVQLILKHIQEIPPPPTSILPSLPSAINSVMLRALAKDPDDRYETTTHFADEVLNALQVGTASAPVMETPTPTASVTVNTPRTPTRKTHTTVTEQQKQIAALHVSLSAFEDALSEEHDAEEVAQLLQGLRSQLEAQIAEQGGTVVERAGQAFLALWGLELAREDDAEHAIRAALALRDTIQTEAAQLLPGGTELPAHFAVNNGLVVLQLDVNTGQFTPSGTMLNILRQIEQAVEPGSILITYDTYRHVLGIFDVHVEPTLRLRGRKEPIELYRVIRARPRTFRLATRGVEGVETHMIGRDGELKLLQDSLMLTIEDREMQVVTCVGDAGVGKSRLLYEFSRWLDSIDQTVLLLQGRATQQSTQRPYALLRDIFSFRFQILDSDPPETLRRKFEQGIAAFLGENSRDKALCIAHLSGFDMSDEPLIRDQLSNAAAFREKALGYLSEFFRALAGRAPVVLQLEDIHWADEPSLNLLGQLMSQNTNLGIMILCMARPELYERRASWGEGQPFHHRLNLSPLSKLDSRRLVREVLQKVENIPADLRDLIVDRADGNPFYIEEMIKVLIEDGVIIKTPAGADESAHWRIVPERLSAVRVPVTLVGVLQARLDMLSVQEKLVLQRAAVVGRIFWDSAVVALGAADQSTSSGVGAILEKLRARELIFQRETSAFAGTHEYVIKHAILRDVIYDSLLKRQQRSYHAAAAEWLRHMSGDRVGEYSALIAEHFERAGEKIRAADYLIQTAKQAFAISAYDQTATLLAHATRLIEGDPAPEASTLKLILLIEKTKISIAKGLYPEAKTTIEELLPLARQSGNQAILAEALTQAGFVAVRQGQYAEAGRYFEEALPLARTLDERPILVEVLRWTGVVASYQAQSERALPYLEESLQLARTLNLNAAIAKALNALAGIAADSGDFDAALKRYHEALTIAKASGDRYSVALIAQNIAMIHNERKEFAEARRFAEESLAGAREIGSLSIECWTLNVLAIAVLGMGDDDAARVVLNQGLRVARSTGDVMRQLDNLGIYAELKAKTQPLAALEMLGLIRQEAQGAQDLINEIEKSVHKVRQNAPALTEDEVQAALARGKALNREQLIRNLLGENEVAGASG